MEFRNIGVESLAHLYQFIGWAIQHANCNVPKHSHKQTCICFALLLNQFSQMVFFCRYIVKFLRVKWFLDGICIEIGNENLCGKIPWCVWALKKANDTPCLVQHTGCKYEYTYLRKYDIGLILDITELSTSPHQLLSCEVWTLRTTT